VALVGAAVVFISPARCRSTRGADERVYRYGITPRRASSRSVLRGRAHGHGERAPHVKTDSYTLSTNGKPDASLDRGWIRPAPNDTSRRPLLGDQVTQTLLPVIALAHHPGARTAAVIGQGSGMTSHFLLGAPALRSLVTIDIEPAMIRGSRAFYPANRRVFDDPRSAFAVDDAKAYFASARRRFDVIVSEPSNPWVSGVSGLFTDEFYARVRGYLAPGGVFGQWLHLYEIDDALVTSVLAALHRHFPAYEVYMVSQSDLFVVASTDTALRRPDWGVLGAPALRADLARTVPLDAPRSTRSAWPTAPRSPRCSTGGRRSTRTTTRCSTSGAERTRFLKQSAEGYRAVHYGAFDPLAARRGWRVGPATSYVAPFALPRHTARARAAALRATWEARAEAIAAGGAPTRRRGRRSAARTPGGCARRSTAAARSRRSSTPVAPRPTGTASCLHAVDVLGDVEGGSPGVADTALHARLRRSPRPRPRRPRCARRSPSCARRRPTTGCGQRRGGGARAAASRGDAWLPAGQLHDGAVVAALAGAPPGARRARREVLGPVLRRRAGDVRSALFTAWISGRRVSTR
jgi:spermidine synthase